MNRSMHYLVMVCLAFGLWVSSVFAASLSDVEKGIFELKHIGMQIEAVEIEMRLQLAREEKDSVDYHKGASIKAAKKAVSDLNNIKANLSTLVLPKDLNELQSQFIGVIGKLVNIYDAISKKTKIDQEKEFQAFWDMMDAYNKNLEAKLDSSINTLKDLKEFNLLELESSFFVNQQDREKFQSVDNMIFKKKNYAEAAKLLKDLLPTYLDTPAEGSIIARLADCGELGDQAAQDVLGDPEYTLELLNKFVLKNKYSPLIQRIYLQWRTLKQIFENGLSNWSKIPNDYYLEILWALAQSIEKHIEANPDDHWAKFQLLLLMNTPLIERWRPDFQYGSSVAIDHYNLWGLINEP